jgi:hypothetical protein
MLAPHCLGPAWDPGHAGSKPRQFIDAVRWSASTLRRHDLLRAFTKWHPVGKRFRGWVEADAFHRMFRALA